METSTNLMERARVSLLEPAGLGERELARLMDQLLRGQVDYADIYFQHSRHESWSLEEGQVKSGSHSIESGAGVRAVAGEKSGFAYSDDIVLPALLEAAGAARAIALQGKSASVPIQWHAGEARRLYQVADPIASIPDEEKVAVLERIER